MCKYVREEYWTEHITAYLVLCGEPEMCHTELEGSHSLFVLILLEPPTVYSPWQKGNTVTFLSFSCCDACSMFTVHCLFTVYPLVLCDAVRTSLSSRLPQIKFPQ